MSTTELAILKKDAVDVVAQKVREFLERGELHLPADYSPENAMKSAWLILQETVDRDKKPALQVCTKDSIANALLDMVVQGLNPAKKQGYFIVYGNKLVFQRSYFGTMALAKRVDDSIGEIYAEVVYEGDIFRYRINRGRKEITEHEQALENVDNKKIKAAYCMIIDRDGQVRKTEIMTIDEIKQAWKQSQMHPVDDKGNIKPGTTHDKFTAEMCKKTVINKACKPIINSSSDSYLFRRAVNRSSEIAAEVEAEEEIAANANQDVIDIEGQVMPEDDPAPPAPAAEQAPPRQDEKPAGGPAKAARTTQPAEPPAETLFPPTGTDGPGF
ncbi:MAG: recombinase RecT [Peptococcaceae bacterium]|nr:recombinase RecT [Peptococcaceae bacterium]